MPSRHTDIPLPTFSERDMTMMRASLLYKDIDPYTCDSQFARPSVRVPVLTSTCICPLVPFIGMVLPSTIPESLVRPEPIVDITMHEHSNVSIHVTYLHACYIPLRSVGETCSLVRLRAIRNCFPRSHWRMLVCRICIYNGYITLNSLRVMHCLLHGSQYQPVIFLNDSHETWFRWLAMPEDYQTSSSPHTLSQVGGGPVRVTRKKGWLHSDIAIYDIIGEADPEGKYRVSGYISSLNVNLVPPNVLAVKIPLEELIHELSAAMLAEVAVQHHVLQSKRHISLNKLCALLAKHKCVECPEFYTLMEPCQRAVDVAQRMKNLRQRKNGHKTDERMRWKERAEDTDYQEKRRMRKRQKYAESVFPPDPPSKQLISDTISGFVHGQSFAYIEERGCAVCGSLTSASKLTPLTDVKCPLSCLDVPNVTRKERMSDEDPFDEPIPGPVLDKRCTDICDDCFEYVKIGQAPPNSLANGHWIGDIPEPLQNLHWTEQLLISKVIHNYCVVKVDISGMHKLRANAICHALPVAKVYTALPPPREELDEVLAFIFIGPTPPTEEIYKRTPFLVRKNKVVNALIWLRRNHIDYRDVEISYENLSSYSDTEPPVIVDYHPSNHTKSPEATAINDSEEDDGTLEGECPFTVQILTVEDVTHLMENNKNDILKSEAAEHFRRNGKALAVGHTALPESLYNNPQLYPKMFPWLFPYGLGGIGNERCFKKIAVAERKKLLLMYHDKRFQKDRTFPLIAFNEEQIKNGTTGSYLLAKTESFDRIVERLFKMDDTTLQQIIEQLKSGQRTALNDDQKEAFRLLADMDFVSSRVDGSVTNRRRMRNQIWSLSFDLGPPSWFITYAPADENHPIAVYYADTDQTYYPAVYTKDKRHKMIGENPVAGARFFKFMTDLFIRHVLGHGLKRRGIYGQTSGYYGTVEQQGRLTLHMHMLIWIKGALTPQEIRDRILDADSEFQKRLVEYLESVHIGEFIGSTMDDMSTKMSELKTECPDRIPPTEELPTAPVSHSDHSETLVQPQLCAENVALSQAHKPYADSNAYDDSNSCPECSGWWNKFVDTVNELIWRCNVHSCRYGCGAGTPRGCKGRFPRKTHPVTSFDPETGYIELRKGEAWVNCVTPVLTYLFRSNTDVTCLLSGTAIKAIIAYTTDYITKPTLKTATMFEVIRSVFRRDSDAASKTGDVKAKARKIINSIVSGMTSKSEIGGPMAAMYLLGHPDHYTSHKFRSLYWRSFVRKVRSAWEKRTGTSIVDETLERQPTDKVLLMKKGEDILKMNTTMDYTCRPLVYENVSLHEWIRRAEKVKVYEPRELRDQKEGEYLVNKILGHRWSKNGKRIQFLVRFELGDSQWLSWTECKRLEALDTYLAEQGVSDKDQLSREGFQNGATDDHDIRGDERDIERIPDHDDDNPCEYEINNNVGKGNGSRPPITRLVSTSPEDTVMNSESLISAQRTLVDESITDADENSSDCSDGNSAGPPFSSVDSDDGTWHVFTSDHPQYGTHKVKLCREQEACVPDFIGGTLPRKDKGNREDYCMTMLTLFKPWRTGIELKSDEESWDEAFNAYNFTERQSEIMKFFHVKHECNDSRDDFSKIRKDNIDVGQDILDELHDEFEDLMYGESTLPDLPDPNASALLADFEKLSPLELSRLAHMQDAARLMENIGALQEIPNNINLHERQDGDGHTPTQWAEQLQDRRKEILETRNAHVPKSDFEQVAGSDVGRAGSKDTSGMVKIIDQSYLQKECRAKSDSDEKLIQDTMRVFSLNNEQSRAFCIVARHASNDTGDQLRMYLGGMAGTGKSQVIKALIHFFNAKKEGHRFMCLAPTGAAAVLISGSTYHSMLGFNQFDVGQKKNIDSAEVNLKDVDYVFIDEVSMLDCMGLYKISERMCLARKISHLPFGGLNVILAGDFAQLPPVMGNSLYDHKVEPRVHSTQSVKQQQASIGKATWARFTTVVVLRQNMRQKLLNENDVKFRRVLENLRYKDCTADDISLLYSRVVGQGSGRPSMSDPNFHNVSIITSWNAYRDKINELGSERFAGETRQVLKTFYSNDRWSNENDTPEKHGRRGGKKRKGNPARKSERIAPEVQDKFWNLSHTASDHLPGKLRLCLGLPIMIKKNIATECGVTNGAEGVVVGWQSRPLTKDKFALDTVFVKLTSPAITIKLGGLPENVVPVTKQALKIHCKMPNGSQLTINREQVPIIPNFAMTDFNSQGRTRAYNVCDLQNCRNHQSVYTCLSRGSSYDGTAIIQGFDGSKVQGGVSGSLRQEFRDIEILDEITRLRFNGKLPPQVNGDDRYQLIHGYRTMKGAEYEPCTVASALRWNDRSDSKENSYPIETPPEVSTWELIQEEKKKKGQKNNDVSQNTSEAQVNSSSASYVTAEGSKALNITSNTQKKISRARASTNKKAKLTVDVASSKKTSKSASKADSQYKRAIISNADKGIITSSNDGHKHGLKNETYADDTVEMIDLSGVASTSSARPALNTITGFFTSRKRKASDLDPSPATKKIKTATSNNGIGFSVRPLGIKWSNNSCAYDSVMAILYNLYCSNPVVWSALYSQQNESITTMTTLFDSVFNRSHSLAQARDSMRIVLNKRDPSTYPKPGPLGTDIFQLCTDIFRQKNRYYQEKYTCLGCSMETSRRKDYVFYNISPGSVDYPVAHHAHTRTGLSSITDQLHGILNYNSHVKCRVCGQNTHCTVTWSSPPTFIPIKAPEGVLGDTVKWDDYITLQGHRYRICGFIYFGNFHFNCRLVDQSGTVWLMDGLKHNGEAVLEGNIRDTGLHFASNESKALSIVLYCYVSHA